MGNLSLPNKKLIDAIANQLTKYARAQTRLTIQILVDEKISDDGNTKKNPSYLLPKKFKLISRQDVRSLFSCLLLLHVLLPITSKKWLLETTITNQLFTIALDGRWCNLPYKVQVPMA